MGAPRRPRAQDTNAVQTPNRDRRPKTVVITHLTSARETRTLSRCCSLRFRNRCALWNGPWMVCLKYLRVPGLRVAPKINADKPGACPARNDLPCFRAMGILPGPKQAHNSHTCAVEVRFYSYSRGLSLMREFSAALALSARCHLNHQAALRGPSGRCVAISGWMRSFGRMPRPASGSKHAASARENSLPGPRSARMQSLPDLFAFLPSEN